MKRSVILTDRLGPFPVHGLSRRLRDGQKFAPNLVDPGAFTPVVQYNMSPFTLFFFFL